MLKQSPIIPMKMSTREIYVKIVRKLTKPLIDAYYFMLKEVIAASPTSGAQEDHLPLLDHFPSNNHLGAIFYYLGAMLSRLRQKIEVIHI
jgi:hypothetical protein